MLFLESSRRVLMPYVHGEDLGSDSGSSSCFSAAVLLQSIMGYGEACPEGRAPLALFVKNLAYDVPKSRLRALFTWYGCNGILGKSQDEVQAAMLFRRYIYILHRFVCCSIVIEFGTCSFECSFDASRFKPATWKLDSIHHSLNLEV